MLKEILAKFRKNDKKEVEAIQIDYLDKEENDTDKIRVYKENGFHKIEIDENTSSSDFYFKGVSNDAYAVLDLLSFNIFWNSNRQEIHDGTYYVIVKDTSIYNFLFTKGKVEIDEREWIEGGEVLETFMSYEPQTPPSNQVKKYSISSMKHNAHGSTTYTKFYDNYSKYGIPALALTEKEAYDAAKKLLEDLEQIEGIETIVDVNLLRKEILDDIKDKLLQPTLKN